VLAKFEDDPQRSADAEARKNYAGTSPVTRASGKKKAVLAGMCATATSPTRSISRPSAR
jgi:hypothetical protein